MTSERFVLLGIAHVRSSWFSELARWSTAAAVPVDFVKAVSVEEVRVRLRSGRAFSAIIADEAVVGLDRDLVDLARQAGSACIVVSSGRGRRDWADLGVSGVLPTQFGRSDLVDLLTAVATPIARREGALPEEQSSPVNTPPAWRGRLVAVTGAPGAGRSTIAMALAQGLAADPRDVDLVCLADLALDSDQGMLHDCLDVVPGITELVDAHRTATPATHEVRALTWTIEERGYHLLLGLRRHRDWTALRPRALERSLEGLQRSFRTVVADVDPDVEGEDECGSTDVDDRNLLARTAMRRADLVIAVGLPGVLGVRHLIRVISDVRRLGVGDDRLLPLVNRAPRGPRARAEITAALGDLLPQRAAERLPSPAFVPDRRRLDDVLRAGAALPAALAGAVARPVRGLLDDAGRPPVSDESEPVRVAPGSLGAWSDGEDEGLAQ